MHSGIVLIGLLSLIAWCIQVLPVISVPVTGLKKHNTLYLSQYKNITFGVFGVCDMVSGTCSLPKIGYSITQNLDYWNATDMITDKMDPIRLPSSATHFISKLLVVHVVAFVITSVLMLECAFILTLELLDDPKYRRKFRQWSQRLFSKQDGESQTESSKSRSGRCLKRRNLTGFLNIMILSAVSSFLSNLMAFLVDILLFVPELSVLGWIQLLPISLMALIASLTCFIKRSISSRKHLDEELFPVSSPKARIYSENDENASDDGIYIYTNGFSSRNANEHSLIGSTANSEHVLLEMETFNDYREQDSLNAPHRH